MRSFLRSAAVTRCRPRAAAALPTSLLRDELGFTRVTITDALDMAAVVTTSDGAVSIGSELTARRMPTIPVATAHDPDVDDIERAAKTVAGERAVVVVTAGATEPGQRDLVRAVERERPDTRRSSSPATPSTSPTSIPRADRGSSAATALTESTVRALADVLTGEHQPTGTLTVTIPVAS